VILRWLFGRAKIDPSEALYAAIVAAARQEKFHADWGVPDTMDGRFDMLALHMFLVLDRLRAFGEEAKDLSQALTDRFFAEMDAALRQVGVGDLSVGKKVRKMAEAFYGRVSVYTAALEKDDGKLREALARNIYAGVDSSRSDVLAKWTRNARKILANQDFSAFAKGLVRFE
jgi:cytochrome b pre-mRNA-processing protein 3